MGRHGIVGRGEAGLGEEAREKIISPAQVEVPAGQGCCQGNKAGTWAPGLFLFGFRGRGHKSLGARAREPAVSGREEQNGNVED